MPRLPMRAVLVGGLFLLSAIAFIDRTNISIAGPQISREFSLGNVFAPPPIPAALFPLIAARFALGVGEAIIYPASNQFVAQWIPVRERGRVNGVIFAGGGAGAGLTPPLLAAIIAAYGWRAAFWFSAAIGLIAGIAWYL